MEVLVVPIEVRKFGTLFVKIKVGSEVFHDRLTIDKTGCQHGTSRDHFETIRSI